MDPVVPLTPVQPKLNKGKFQPQQKRPRTPLPSSFAAHQIQASHNRRSAAILFTPHKQHALQATAHGLQSSPTPNPAIRLGSPTPNPAIRLCSHALHLAPQLRLEQSSSSEENEELEAGVQRLNLGSKSSSDGSQSHSGSHSHSSSHHTHAPCAGPHSKMRKALSKPKGGAKDVWTFFKQVGAQHECQLCK